MPFALTKNTIRKTCVTRLVHDILIRGPFVCDLSDLLTNYDILGPYYTSIIFENKCD